MAVLQGFVSTCLIVTLGLSGSSLANSRQTKTVSVPAFARVAQKSCNPAKQKCCLNSDKMPVPPGSRRGPYTCLPNGTWG
jgi:hypothetical protein